MIARIDRKTAERLLEGANDVFALKIASNLQAYDGYDFHEVYGGQGLLIGRYYNDLVIRTEGVISEEAAQKLALFLRVCGFKSALCGMETGMRLVSAGWDKAEKSVVLKFSKVLVPEEDDVVPFEDIVLNPALDWVFPIIKDGFPDIDHDGWYVDMSHKVRHGVACVYLYNGATVTSAADMNGAVYLTLLASSKAVRGTGAAKNLLRTLGMQFEKQGKEAYILCRDELVPFYNKAGFYVSANAMTVYNKQMRII